MTSIQSGFSKRIETVHARAIIQPEPEFSGFKFLDTIPSLFRWTRVTEPPGTRLPNAVRTTPEVILRLHARLLPSSPIFKANSRSTQKKQKLLYNKHDQRQH